MTIQMLPPKQTLLGSFAKGAANRLAENVPKEIERRGLAEDLKNISEQKDLTPFQQFSGLASARGSTPQIVESGSKLLRDQAKMDALNRRANKGTSANSEIPMPERSAFEQRMEGLNQQVEQKPPAKKGMNEKLAEQETAQTGAATDNPLEKKYLPAGPFTQQMHFDAMDNAISSGLASNYDEAEAIANDAERRYKQAPEEYRKELAYKAGIDKDVDDRYDAELATRLQKEGKETFNDLSGEEQLNIKKKARNAVATGKMTPQQSAEYYSKKSLDIAKDKGRVKQIANRDVIDRLMPSKKEEALKNLINIGKNFQDMGMSEDYYNLLRMDTGKTGYEMFTPEQKGMGLSKGGAALIAYPRSEPVKNLMNKVGAIKTPAQTRNFTEDLIKNMSPNDSVLAIARNMKQRYPGFDENAYFDYLRENQDRLGTNSRLIREINAGVSDFLPDWRDIGLFPAFTKSVAND